MTQEIVNRVKGRFANVLIEGRINRKDLKALIQLFEDTPFKPGSMRITETRKRFPNNQ